MSGAGTRGAGAAAVIDGVGAVCAVGRGVRQVAASVRAGIGRVVRSPVHDARHAPISMALFPEEELEPLAGGAAARPLGDRWRRLARLSAPALREVVADLPEDAPPLPLFVGLPEPTSSPAGVPGAPPLSAEAIGQLLGEQAGVGVDARSSQVFANGRAGALFALEAAVRALAEGKFDTVIVGGVDSYLDLMRLAALDAEGRILGPRVIDGFVPGEGAAFLRLSRTGARPAPAASAGSARVGVLGAAIAQDAGHRYSDEPARGEGLATALESLYAGMPAGVPPIGSVFAGFNGESFDAKAWGVARLRHADRFTPAAGMHHPADCYGDVGAATGAMLLALAAYQLGQRRLPGPALVFAASDRAPRACALLDPLS